MPEVRLDVGAGRGADCWDMRLGTRLRGGGSRGEEQQRGEGRGGCRAGCDGRGGAQFVRVMGCMGRDLGFFGMVWAVLVMAARCAVGRVSVRDPVHLC